jgi:hypothetical protein
MACARAVTTSQADDPEPKQRRRAQELFSIWNINIESCRIWPMLQRSGRIGFNSDMQFFFYRLELNPIPCTVLR